MTAIKKPTAYNNLKGVMAKKGVSQKDMAKVIDISPTTFNFKINRTGGRDFRLDEASKLADYLGIKVDDFF